MSKPPCNWIQVSIDDICDFSNGHGFRPPDWSDRGYPIIRIQNLNGSSNFNYYAEQPEEDWIVEPGTILFAWAGTKGVSFGPTIWNGPKGVLNQHIYRIQPKNGIDKYWLFCILQEITSDIERKAHGFKATLVHVRKTDITGQLISCPPLAEQRKIAEILGTWDAAIAKAERLVEALKQRKKALMQRLLTGEVRFPGFEDEWEEVALGQVFTERRETGRVDLPLLSITNNQGVVYRDSLERRDTSTEDKSKYLRICKGDIGYNTMRMWQGVSALSNLEGIVSPAYTICVPNDDIDAEFMSYLFKFRPIIHKFYRYSQGLVDDTLSLKYNAFAKIIVKIPRLKEQKQIANVLKVCEQQITQVEQHINRIQKQKRGLMQRLLSGEVRVSVESEAEELLPA